MEAEVAVMVGPEEAGGTETGAGAGVKAEGVAGVPGPAEAVAGVGVGVAGVVSRGRKSWPKRISDSGASVRETRNVLPMPSFRRVMMPAADFRGPGVRCRIR